MKIVQFLYSFNPGGIESFLTQLTENLPTDSVESYFISFYDGPLRQRVESTGAKVYIVGSLVKPKTWFQINRILKTIKPDVANCHVAVVSGLFMAICKTHNIPTILYCHNAISAVKNIKLFYKCFSALNLFLAKRIQTYGIGVSSMVCKEMWGEHTPQNVSYVNLGIDFTRYAPSDKTNNLKEYFNIPSNHVVIANVAGYRPPKNYDLFIDIAYEILQSNQKVTFLMIGEGSERLKMERQIVSYGIQKHCVLTGFVDNVPEILTKCCDIFLFPSLCEGLGLGLVEAQAAGLECFYSDVVPKEAVIIPSITHALSLDLSAKDWANKILQVIEKDPKTRISKKEAYQMAIESPFNMPRVVENYLQIWNQLKR